MSEAFNNLKARFYDLNALNSAISIFDWDQNTLMPRGGAEARAEHVGILSRMSHEKLTSDETGKLLQAAAAEVEGDDKAFVERAQRNYDLATKIPTPLVVEKSHLAAVAHEKWVEARAKNDFASFSPTLERMFEIAREEAEHLGYSEHIYDALLDQYEEGSTAAECTAMFKALQPPLTDLVKQISAQPETDDSWLYGDWDVARQKAFTEMLIKEIGFDMNRGRQDTSPHPFCTGWSVGDIRLTTRFKDYIGSAIFGSLHEAGHGMYEQGSPMAWDRTPLAGGVSLGVHESQSRLWENIVGRSKPFWTYFYPKLQAAFPELMDKDLDTFYKAVNKVKPSFIRVEADEVTYNLHVMIRYELECDLLSQNVQIKDLPEAWNAKYSEYLGVTPNNDSEGCLQDVHWSQGSIGYFPTYSMGNLLSYQFWNHLNKDVANVDSYLESGNTKPVLGWLQEKIYVKGSRFKPKELVKQVTGETIQTTSYLQGLTQKYKSIYSL